MEGAGDQPQPVLHRLTGHQVWLIVAVTALFIIEYFFLFTNEIELNVISVIYKN